MPADIDQQQRVHLLHIGKTGGTALGTALKAYPTTRDYVITVHYHETTLSDIPVGEKVIFFLREPIKRFISSFYSRQRKGQPRYNCAWTAGEEQAFNQFATPNSLGHALADNESERYRDAARAMKEIYHVRSSYYDWFGDDQYFTSRVDDILYIGFQESLSDDFITLKRTLGLPEDAALPTDDVGAHRNPASVDKRIDEIANKALHKWYEKEYHFINLCKKMISEEQTNMGCIK